MWGTPSVSRLTVARALTAAAISPEVWGKGRQAIQYAAPTIAASKTAMLRLIARNSGVLNSKLQF